MLVSIHLASGAGGPQRRRGNKSIPTSARLAQLRLKALKAQKLEREGRTLLAVNEGIVNERESRNLANVFPFVGGNR